MRLEDWRGDITVFPSEFETIPEESHKGLSWRELDKVVAGAAPVIRAKKAWLPFYVPCLLDSTKPYSGKTAKRFPAGACGPMRSREHVRDMTATVLVMDLDKCERSEVVGYLRGLRDKGISFLTYTTYSNGAPGKTGYRMRLLVPVDEPLTMERYKAAHDALNDYAFGGRADRSGASLCQQQSVWGCFPDRVKRARRARSDAGVLSVATLPMEAPRAPERSARTSTGVGVASGANRSDLPSVQRIERAVSWLVADEGYEVWIRVLMALAALRGHIGIEAAEEFAQRYHQTSPPDSTRAMQGHQSQYDPISVVGRTSTMSEEGAVRCLLGRARDRARRVVIEGLRGAHGDRERFKSAAVYLAEFHSSTYTAIQNEATERRL